MNGVKRIAMHVLASLPRHMRVTIVLLNNEVECELEKISNGRFEFKVSPVSSKIFVHFVYLPFIALTSRYDLFWSNNHRLPLFVSKQAKTIFTVHDLSSIFFPQFLAASTLFAERLFFRSGVMSADRIIVLSKATEADLKQTFPHLTAQVFRANPKYKAVGEPSAERDNPRFPGVSSYFLFVGTMEPRKNLELLLDAHATLPLEIQKKHPLVLAGNPGWKLRKFRRKFLEQKLDHVIFFESPTGEELHRLYTHAHAVVMPSIYEGFGLPVLEALSHGKTLICSDLPVFHEIAGDVAIFFDRSSKGKLTEALLSSTEIQDREVCRKAALKRFEEISAWESRLEDAFSTP